MKANPSKASNAKWDTEYKVRFERNLCRPGFAENSIQGEMTRTMDLDGDGKISSGEDFQAILSESQT